MLSIESITAFIVASTILCVAPGPDNIFVLTHSAAHGWKAGILVTLGLCTGLLVHTSAVAIGVAAVIKASTLAFTLLKFAGAGYLLYLAWKSFTSQKKELGEATSLPTSALYRRGIIMNVTNPKVSIFFLAFLPQFVDANSGSTVVQIFALGVIFIICTITVFGGIALLAGTIGRFLRRSPSVQLLINRLAGLIFLLLALRIALYAN